MGARDEPTIEGCHEMLDHVQTYWGKQIEFDNERKDMYWEEDPVQQEDTAAPNRRYRITPERMTANEIGRASCRETV